MTVTEFFTYLSSHPATSDLAAELRANCRERPASDPKPAPTSGRRPSVISRASIAALVVCVLVALLGGVFTARTATASTTSGGTAVVAATANASGTAGWTVTANGTVHTSGTARDDGDLAGFALHSPIVAIAAIPSGTGYWLLGSDGGVFTFGSAHFYGSTGGIHLNQPVVGIAATPSGHGYWLVARDGGIFTFGDAAFYGSTGAMHLNQPIVGIATEPSVKGYWIVASDGGVFPFGAARFAGSTGALRLAQPILAIAATSTGRGYWLVASDGGIFAFGDARFFGSTAGSCVGAVGIIPTTHGYIIAASDGSLRAMDVTTAHATAPDSCDRGECPTSVLNEVVADTNAQRSANGLPALAVSGQLTDAAGRRSLIQATNKAMNHDGWDTVIRATGYPAGAWGENVGAGFTSAAAVMTGWMNSPDHRANVLSPHYREIGVGCAYSVDHVAYWTQDFGGPSY